VEQNLRIARFGLYEADLAAGELRKAGLRIKLQDRPFQILAVLLEKPGEILGREELQKRLWPAETFVDFEHGMNTAITKLRQALCDEADNPRYIETLPRRGYRFIAPVTFGGFSSSDAQLRADLAAGDGDAKAAPAGTSDVAPSASRSLNGHLHFRYVIWIAVLVFLCGLGTASWYFYSRAYSRSVSSEIRIAPLNGLAHESDVAFSPDGDQVAFVWNGEPPDRVHIYISQVGAGTPRRLTNSPWWEIAPVWSPDGKYIAFIRFANDAELNGIYIASSLGGSERKVYSMDPRNGTREQIDWSPDGKYLVFAERNSPTDPTGLYLLSLDNLEKSPLTFPQHGILGDSSPAFSRDGKSVAFMRDYLDTQEIFVLPLKGGTPRQVTSDKRIVQGVSWNADGRYLIYSSNRGGTPSLWRIPVAGGTPEVLPLGGGARAIQPTVAHHGNRMAYTSFNYSSNIWRAELPLPGAVSPSAYLGRRRQSKAPAMITAGADNLEAAPDEEAGAPGISPPAKFIISTELEEGPQYSPDGKRIVFQSTRTGNYEIWRCDADGSNLVQLTHMEGPLTGTPRWSPDGREIVFDSRPSGHSHLFLINAEGGSPRQITTGDIENGVADWSADGKSVYYGSSRGGSWEIWKIPTQGGTPVQITHQGGFAPQSSPDGKFIYYAKGRELPGLWRVPVDGGEEKRILDAPPPTAWGYFTVTAKGIYYGDAPSRTRKDMGIYFYDFKTQKASPIRLLDPFGSEGAPGLSISPDGRYALYTTAEKPSAKVILVENFRY